MSSTPDPSTSEELDLSYYLDVILRRRWIVISSFIIVFLSSLLYTFTVRPVYRAGTMLVIEKERGSSVLAPDGTIESSDDDYYQTQYKLLKSESLMQAVYDKLDLAHTPDFAEPRARIKFDRAVNISPVLRSRLVYIYVDSHDAALAARIANSLAETFVEQNMASQLFISKEVLQALQVKSTDPASKASYGALPSVVNNPLIQQLKAEDAKLQSQYADMYARLTPKHPDMIALHSNILSLEAKIQEETEKIVQSLKTELSGQLKGNNVRIIDAARIPDKPAKPNKTILLTLGFLGGLALGLALAFLVETLDQSVRTQEDVENKLSLPFLGQIPFAADASGSVYQSLMSKELSLSSEAVRNLRTMVDFAGVGQNAKAILVTSTVQDEGKSYVSSNLAVAFSQLGENVLLITGDLRRPSLHKNFGVSTERGLSDFLAKGQRVEELAGLVLETEVPGLHLMPCGPRPPNPSELLNTPRLGALMAWAKSNFDRVIVDCTPMFPIHDTLLWGRHVNAGVFVVRYGRTRAPLIAKACQRLQEGGIKILGAVVNAAKPGGLAYSSYGYHYQAYYHAYEQPSDLAKKSS